MNSQGIAITDRDSDDEDDVDEEAGPSESNFFQRKEVPLVRRGGEQQQKRSTKVSKATCLL